MTVGSRLEHGQIADPAFHNPGGRENRDRGIWRLVLIGLVAWLVLNRAVPDLYVLPLGIAIRPSQAVLVGLMVLLLLANIASPRRWPSGVAALSGMLLLIVITLAPFMASGGLDEYQSDGVERGLFHFVIYAVLFLCVYQAAQRRSAAVLLLNVTLAMTIWQALLVLNEWRVGAAGVVNWPIWESIGLAVDGISRSANFRPGEQFRATGTAPHPIVMSALFAIGILLAVILLLGETDNRRKALLSVSMLPLVLAMMLVDARTGFVILIVGGLTVVGLEARRIPRLLPMGLSALTALGVAVVMSPNSVRSTLNLFWFASTDNSVGLRVDRLSTLPQLIAENPILGPGWLTNDPSVLLWDNTYSLGLVELGIIGVAVYLVFLISSVVRMIGSRRLAINEEETTLLLVGIVGGIALLVGGATFDALAFDQFLPTCLLLLGVGLAAADGALRRRQHEETDLRTLSSGPTPEDSGIHRLLQENQAELA